MRNEKELSDLGLITALITKGYIPIDSYKQGSRALFVFEWDNELSRLEQLYFSNQLDVDARSFNTTLRDIKKKIYSIVNPDNVPYK